MITTKSGLKILFKHTTVHALEEKAFRQANECGLYDGFSLDGKDLKEYNYLVENNKIGRTLCIIQDHTDKVLFEGESKCDEEDVYRKEKGCFVALENATKDCPKDLRAEIFDAFSNRKLDTKGKVLIDGKYYDEQVLKVIIDSVSEPDGRFSVIQKHPTYHPYVDGQKIGTV